MNKKTGAGAAGRSGGNLLGKSSDGKSKTSFESGSKSGKPLMAGGGKSLLPGGGKSLPPMGGKSSGLSDSRKSFSPSFISPKSKSSTTFGIIWLPTRRNKKKDLVYNPHKDDHSKERSPTMYNIMSADSSENHKKKEEVSELLPADRLKAPVASAAGVALAATAQEQEAVSQDKKELIQRTEPKDAAGDTNENLSNDDDDDYLENDGSDKQMSPRSAHHAPGDGVDSVYLRAPPPHKARAQAAHAPAEEEGCGLKCLYYTLQCCDCVLM